MILLPCASTFSDSHLSQLSTSHLKKLRRSANTNALKRETYCSNYSQIHICNYWRWVWNIRTLAWSCMSWYHKHHSKSDTQIVLERTFGQLSPQPVTYHARADNNTGKFESLIYTTKMAQSWKFDIILYHNTIEFFSMHNWIIKYTVKITAPHDICIPGKSCSKLGLGKNAELKWITSLLGNFPPLFVTKTTQSFRRWITSASLMPVPGCSMHSLMYTRKLHSISGFFACAMKCSSFDNSWSLTELLCTPPAYKRLPRFYTVGEMP